MATFADRDILCNRLPLDLIVPDSVLGRRGGISFGSSVCSQSKPRLERRGAISFDREDINALYVRQLGDVRMKSQENSIYQQILSRLTPSERQILQGLERKEYKTNFRNKFSTLSGMRRPKRCIVKPTADGQSLIDDFYRSSTKCLLAKTSDWAFDVFSLDQSSNGRSLFHIVLKLFQEHNLIDHFNLDIVKLMKFASLVEEGYHQNPYHNAIHAADVTQAMHCYILQEKIARHMSPLETMISLISAITHDLDHPGVNQAFLIATSNHLASLYNNNSVLENHHWRSAVGVLHESGLLDHLPLPMRKNIIKQMKSLILATDMTRQQEFYSKLKAHVSSDDLDMTIAEDRHFILQIALKCADISNPCRRWNTCKAWSKRVCDEFFLQGDYERKLLLPITNLCDRYKFSVAKIQTGFIDFVVDPLFTEFEKFMPCHVLREQLSNMKRNREMWETLSKQEAVAQRPLSIGIDINSNMETVDCDSSSADSGTESNGVSSPTTTDNSSHSELDELSSDITDIHSDIVRVAERMERSDINLDLDLDRRKSLPNNDGIVHSPKDLHSRRESFPLIHDNHRTSLPPTSLYQAISFDRLVEKLTSIEKKIPSSQAMRNVVTNVNLDNLMSEPRLSTLSPSIETSKITNYYVTKKLILK